MNYAEIITGLTSTVVSYPLWTFIHESSHVLAASCFGKIKEVRWKLYPHRTPKGTFAFASVGWEWEKIPKISLASCAAIYSAPRIPDVLAVLMFPAFTLLEGPASLAWAALWGGGLVDLFVGSIGISDGSDLKRTAGYLKINPWLLRVAGWALIAGSLITVAVSV